ncbi:MAG: RNA polymerase sigma factor, partial [Rhodoferax sp.]
AWLFSVMHNLFVNQLRQSAVAGRPAILDIDDLADELPTPASSPDQALDLQRCLLRLPPEQREILLLVSMEGMSYADIAKVTGVPLGTVMSRLSRARGRLQALLDAPAHGRTNPATNQAPPTRPVTLHRLK